MRIRVHRPSLSDQGARMTSALEGLALRGHEITWAGSWPGSIPPADVVVGGSAGPVRTLLAGMLAGANVMLLDLHTAALERWGWMERYAWDMLYTVALVDEREAEGLAADPRGLPRERIGLWAPDTAEGRAGAPDPAHPDVEVLERACERALARHRGSAARGAVFLDRDGTLVRETGYLSDPGAVELLPGAGQALRNLAEAGVPLVVISNQSGVGRGLFTARDVHAVMARLRALLRVHGVELGAIYFCPHHPDEDCPCRKPGTALLERAAEDLHLSLADSVMIGDKRIDAAAGRNAGGRGVLVRTGYGREEELRADAPGPPPDRVCDDLAAAVAWWLGPE